MCLRLLYTTSTIRQMADVFFTAILYNFDMDNAQKILTLPEIALIAITRVALGVGMGLLLAERLSESRRAAAGWALVLMGALTTVPLVALIFGGNYRQSEDAH